jgi:hypothetical protein
MEQFFVFNEIRGELIMNKMMVFCCCIIAAGFVFPACSHCSCAAAGKDNVVVHEVGTSSDANCTQVDQSQHAPQQANSKSVPYLGIFVSEEEFNRACSRKRPVTPFCPATPFCPVTPFLGDDGESGNSEEALGKECHIPRHAMPFPDDDGSGDGNVW